MEGNLGVADLHSLAVGAVLRILGVVVARSSVVRGIRLRPALLHGTPVQGKRTLWLLTALEMRLAS